LAVDENAIDITGTPRATTAKIEAIAAANSE
jgi:hypothetical protein